jgi:hypothetical protein
MSKKNPTVAERAVRGVLGGWVFGKARILVVLPQATGVVVGYARVEVPAEAVKKMLANERAEKAKKARRK